LPGGVDFKEISQVISQLLAAPFFFAIRALSIRELPKTSRSHRMKRPAPF
jgi:hypothetical protein